MVKLDITKRFERLVEESYSSGVIGVIMEDTDKVPEFKFGVFNSMFRYGLVKKFYEKEAAIKYADYLSHGGQYFVERVDWIMP